MIFYAWHEDRAYLDLATRNALRSVWKDIISASREAFMTSDQGRHFNFQSLGRNEQPENILDALSYVVYTVAQRSCIRPTINRSGSNSRSNS